MALQWRAKAGTIAAAVFFAIGFVVASMFGLQTWLAKNELKAKVDELEGANLRLSRKIALRVAQFRGPWYSLEPNWYQIASDYSGAIALVTSPARPNDLGTGFIVRGSALYMPWGDEPIFMTVSHIISSKDPSATGSFRPEDAQARFPGLAEKNAALKFKEILWEHSFQKWGVTVLRIKGALPFGAKSIEKIKSEEFEHLPDVDLRKPIGLARPLAIIGVGFETGFTLFLNDLVGVLERDSEGKPLVLGYTYATAPGASGSPVFDVQTGELIAIHTFRLSENMDLGGGISIMSVIAAIKSEMGQSN